MKRRIAIFGRRINISTSIKQQFYDPSMTLFTRPMKRRPGVINIIYRINISTSIKSRTYCTNITFFSSFN